MGLASAIVRDFFNDIFKWLFPKLFKPYVIRHSFVVSKNENDNKAMEKFAYEHLMNGVKFSKLIEVWDAEGKDINGKDVTWRHYKITLI
jgi:hypothetical protein